MPGEAQRALAEARVLLVDDRELGRELLRARLARAGYDVTAAASGEEAWTRFQERPFDLVVTDLRMPGLDGIGLIRRLRSAASREPRVPVLLVTAFGTLSSAAAAGRAGVTDCFAFDHAGIDELVARCEELLAADEPTLPLELLGQGAAVAAARDRVRSVATLHTPVLVSGERGTGHAEVIAYLHAFAQRPAETLRRVECSVDPGATPDAADGACHLAEIQDLSPDAQAAWRRFLVEAQLREEPSRSRVLASTTKDLRVLAAQQRFAPDLARELCQFEIWLPPLRERRDDLPKLVEAMIARVAERIGRPGIGIAQPALERLCACAWWENFPELEAVLESLAAFAPGLEITESQAELVLLDSDPVARAARERARSEREQLLSLLDECGGNFTHMADRLKVDRGTIRYRLRKHGILARPGARGGA
jgi:DNA-binding NtrC family response regulator